MKLLKAKHYDKAGRVKIIRNKALEKLAMNRPKAARIRRHRSLGNVMQLDSPQTPTSLNFGQIRSILKQPKDKPRNLLARRMSMPAKMQDIPISPSSFQDNRTAGTSTQNNHSVADSTQLDNRSDDFDILAGYFFVPRDRNDSTNTEDPKAIQNDVVIPEPTVENDPKSNRSTAPTENSSGIQAHGNDVVTFEPNVENDPTSNQSAAPTEYSSGIQAHEKDVVTSEPNDENDPMSSQSVAQTHGSLFDMNILSPITFQSTTPLQNDHRYNIIRSTPIMPSTPKRPTKGLYMKRIPSLIPLRPAIPNTNIQSPLPSTSKGFSSNVVQYKPAAKKAAAFKQHYDSNMVLMTSSSNTLVLDRASDANQVTLANPVEYRPLFDDSESD